MLAKLQLITMMKQFILITTCCFAFLSLHAQQAPTSKENNLQRFKNLLKQNDMKLNRNNKGLFTFFEQNPPVFLYRSEQGSVYASPLDSMRIFVPDFSRKMPVAQDSLHLFMPNPFHNKSSLDLSSGTAIPNQDKNK
jgi:hypothetical protein